MIAIALTAVVLAAPAQAVPVPSPAAEVASAWKDARSLPPEQLQQTRYLSLYAVAAEKRIETLKVLTFHVNSLSREADLARPRRVTDTLYAVELDAYGWDPKVYDRLAEADPWFHAQIEGVREVSYDYGYTGADGKWIKTRTEKVKEKHSRQTVHAPWLPYADISALATLMLSDAPVLRADWFIIQTGEQIGRKAGYYDFLGLKKQDDAEKLTGMDRVAATRIRKEVAAIVTESGVALNNRQIFRFGTIGGSWWETRDVDASVKEKNSARNLDQDFKAQALEIYYTLPNGLFGFVLSDAAGKLADTAPDKFASDGASTNTDRRVRVGISCIRCHVEGLRPIDDYSRKVFRVGNETALGSADREKSRRLKQLYLGPLQRALTDDRTRYAEVLNELTGLKPDTLSKAYATVWAAYESAPLLPADAARELGCTEAELLGVLLKNLKGDGKGEGGGLTDLVLAGWLSDPTIPLRREHFEEQTPVLFTLQMRGNRDVRQ